MVYLIQDFNLQLHNSQQNGEHRSHQSGRCAGSKTSGFRELYCLSVSRLHEGNWDLYSWRCRFICPSEGSPEEASLSSPVESTNFNSGLISGKLCSDSLGNTEMLRPLVAARNRQSP